MGKRVLLITRYFPPLDSIATIRMFSWAKGLVARGHEVTILTTTKTKQVLTPFEADLSPYEVVEVDYFDPLVTFGGEKKRALASSGTPGFKSWAIQFYRSRLNERMPGRTDGWILPAIAELRRRKRAGQTYDTIISSYGPPAAHIIGCKAKKLFSAHWIADYRDLWIENATYTGVFPFTWLERFLERKCVAQADVLTTISEPYREFLQKKFPRIPCQTITNGYDADRIDAVSSGYFDKQEKSPLRLIYTGALYPKTRDPSPLFQAVRELLDANQIKPTDLQLLFYGGVADALPSLIQRYRLGEIAHYKGAVSQEEAYRIQKSADILLFLEDPAPKVAGVLTGKLFEYLYMDAPILAVGVGENSSAAQLIAKAGAGITCGQSVQQIKQVLLDWVANGAVVERKRDVIGVFSRASRARALSGLVEAG